MRRVALWRLLAGVVVGSLLLGFWVAVTRAQEKPPHPAAAAPAMRFPAVSGTKRRAQVQAIRIPTAVLNRYPALAEQQVGSGLVRMLAELLLDTGHFDLPERPEPLARRLGKSWQRLPDGLGLEETSRQGKAAAEFLVSVDIFDLLACAPLEPAAVSGDASTCTTSVGVQVQIANTAGRFVPGVTHPLSPQGRYSHRRDAPLLGSSPQAFDHSAIGQAMARALRYAVLQALARFGQEAW